MTRWVFRTAVSVTAMILGGCSVAAAPSLPSSTPPAAVSPPSTSSTTASGPTAPRRPSVAVPPVNATADYQLGGPYAPAAGVGIVTRDRRDAPAAKTYGICYVNAFQTQPEEKAFWTRQHPTLLLRDASKKLIEDPDWPGEYLLDISTAAKRSALAGIVGGWFDGCAKAGYRAVEPDNLDSWTRSHGRLKQAHAIAMSRLLIQRAHRAGLAVAQKNAAELDGRALGFDFAVAEECQVYDECEAYLDRYGAHVIEIEYTDNPRRFYTRACAAQGRRISVLLRDRDVVPRGQPGYAYAHC